MPWSGSSPNQSATRTDGTRTGSDTWAQASAASVKILSTSHDTHDQDLADMIDDCLKKDGGNTASADIPMGGFTLTAIAEADARTEPARFSQLQDNKGEYCATVGGTADVITLTPTIAITAYAAGQRFSFLASGTNTGATTCNVSGVGAKSVVRNDGANTALSAGDITSGQMVDIEYDGTRFKLMNVSFSVASGVALNSGAVVSWNSGDVTLTHSANALAFAGASSGYSFDDDLLLPSGGVINWNSGDVTITHSANALSFAGASIGYVFDATVAPATNDGAPLGNTTNQWSDLFLASGAVINFNNGDVTLTHSANTLALAGASSGYTFDALVSGTASVRAHSGTGIPAGGTAGAGFTFSSTSNFGIFFGSGAPSLSAAKGSLYLRSDGTNSNERLYTNTDGGTTWAAIGAGG